MEKLCAFVSLCYIIFIPSLSFLIPLLLFSSCNETSNRFQLKGKFKNINQGEFYIYDLDLGRKDTIGLREGQFTYETEMRDTTTLVLLFPNYSELPIIATPGGKVKMKGDVSHLKETEITGTDANEEMTAFRLQTADLMPPEVKQKAEQFINEHPESPVCHYLLRRYFILALDADYNHIFELAQKMLEANPSNIKLIQLNQRLDAVKNVKNDKRLPKFKFKDIKGKTVSDSLLNKKVNVILAWASWNYDSQASLRQVRRLQKEHPKDISVISIRLDASQYEGKATMERDSIAWPDICDGQIWESPAVKKLGIAFIPDNVLIDKDKNIVARTLKGSDLKQKIEDMLK